MVFINNSNDIEMIQRKGTLISLYHICPTLKKKIFLTNCVKKFAKKGYMLPFLFASVNFSDLKQFQIQFMGIVFFCKCMWSPNKKQKIAHHDK